MTHVTDVADIARVYVETLLRSAAEFGYMCGRAIDGLPDEAVREAGLDLDNVRAQAAVIPFDAIGQAIESIIDLARKIP